jgi:hypothetical protein
MRPDKLEGLSLQVLEFVGKARATQSEDLIDASFLGKLLVLPANVRLDWKVIARYKLSSLFGLIVSNEGKSFITLTPEDSGRPQICRLDTQKSAGKDSERGAQKTFRLRLIYTSDFRRRFCIKLACAFVLYTVIFTFIRRP